MILRNVGDDEDEWEDCGSVESGGVEEMEASQVSSVFF